MSDLIVLAFDNPDGAFQLRDKLIALQKQHIVTLEDAAVVVRKDDGKVKVKQVTSLAGAGALGGAFWGMLIGLLFWMPWLGLAIGAVTGALAGKFSDIGVDDAFIKEVGNTIEPGHSALFLLIREATTDKLMDQIKDFDAKVIQTSLSTEDEDKLRELFSGHDADEAEEAAAA
ncbi:MAG: DUF1269 domain-containing protein [Anaerolineales bacterium]|nr:DUF1269 domain-containing protein [Anaerolineales bacterium]